MWCPSLFASLLASNDGGNVWDWSLLVAALATRWGHHCLRLCQAIGSGAWSSSIDAKNAAMSVLILKVVMSRMKQVWGTRGLIAMAMAKHINVSSCCQCFHSQCINHVDVYLRRLLFHKPYLTCRKQIKFFMTGRNWTTYILDATWKTSLKNSVSWTRILMHWT